MDHLRGRRARLHTPRLDCTPWAATRDRILDTVEGLGIPVLDLTPAFAEDGDPLSFFHFRVKSHSTAAGYAIVAEEILLRLVELESAEGRKGRVDLSPAP